MITRELIPAALANHLWQSTLFAAGAALLALALRRNRAQIRYALWLIVSVKFLVPFSLLVALGTHLKWPAAAVAARPAVSTAIQQIGQPLLVPDIFSGVSRAAAPASAHVGAVILLLIWLCGFFAVLASWLRGWMRIRAALRTAVPLPFAAPIKILSSPSLLEPGVFGIFRPVLVLPGGITGHLTSKHLDAILAHELCHLRRRDNLAAVLHMLVEALFWFHPLVWWIGARLVEERERACDEEVLRLGNQPNVYAESILTTCQFYFESPLACVSGITGSDLKRRIVRIMSESLGVRLSFRKKVVLAATGIVVLAIPLAVGLTNAEQGSNASASSFEVASIKRSLPGNDMSISGPRGQFTARRVTTKLLIQNAYDVHAFQIVGGPNWINSERYDVRAKSEDADNIDPNQLKGEEQRRFAERRLAQLQSLLADRFELKLHRVTKEQPVYALVVDKHGPKLQKAKGPDYRASYGMTMSPGLLTATSLTMESLAANLSNELGRIVVDKTGLAGHYDFVLRWTPDQTQRTSSGFSGPTRGSLDNNSPDGTDGPSLFTALQEQLGLKVEPMRGPVSFLIIDHVEKPTEN